ncbi:MAG: hypothetical protein Q7U75_12640 [Desulfobacterales bacterium]|nr:hypothetical protein [Desulfobacterales bacterium]
MARTGSDRHEGTKMIPMPAPGTPFGTYYCKSNESRDNFWSICESMFTWHLCGYRDDEAVPVELVADPGGEYLGWLDAGGRHGGRVCMVQHRKVFNIQFPYGYEAAEERGEGLAVGLSVRPCQPPAAD